MKHDFAAAMRRAFAATRGHSLADATRAIQDVLGRALPQAHPETARPEPRDITPKAEQVDDAGEVNRRSSAQDGAGSKTPPPQRPGPAPKFDDIAGLAGGARSRQPLGDVLQALRDAKMPGGGFAPLGKIHPAQARPVAPPPIPEGALFTARPFACPAGERGYKLYRPASMAGRARGLVVMLHGCTQNADDFARGTGMNALAEAHGLLVVYPNQIASANSSGCWNWFTPAHQVRGLGEPAIIAGITQEVMAEHGLERDRVFVAGLSAGGAMAVVMGETYPELYSGVGVHSGLAYRSAHDVMSAFAAMRGDAGGPQTVRGTGAGAKSGVRTMVFQGSSDQTVHPSNAIRIVDAVQPEGGGPRAERGRSSGGRSYTRTVVEDAVGAPVLEYWLIDGAGHAWSGGDAGGSYTDPQGPDASAEMVRFFLGHA